MSSAVSCLPRLSLSLSLWKSPPTAEWLTSCRFVPLFMAGLGTSPSWKLAVLEPSCLLVLWKELFLFLQTGEREIWSINSSSPMVHASNRGGKCFWVFQSGCPLRKQFFGDTRACSGVVKCSWGPTKMTSFFSTSVPCKLWPVCLLQSLSNLLHLFVPW